MEARTKLSKAYLSNLHVNLYIADYIECDENWREQRHMPEYNKLYFICDGNGWVETGDKSIFPKTDDLVFIPANKPHAFSYINDNYYKKYWCHFTATIGQKNIFDIFDVPNVIKIEKDKSYLLKLFQDLVRYDRVENIDAILKAKAILLQIIAYFMETTNAKELKIFQSSSIEKLEQLLAYIDKHLNEPMTVEELADIVHLQVNYFIKFFKSHLGNTPMNYVKHQRLEKAKRFLLDTPMHISKVAEKVGYTDVSHFSNQFKRYAGMAPSQFRKYRQYDEEIKTKVNIIQK